MAWQKTRREAPFAMNGNYEGKAQSKNGPTYTQEEGIEAYVRGREQMKAQLAKNRCQTSVFDSEPPPPTPDRPLFGKSPRKAVGGRDAEGAGFKAEEGFAMYAENRRLAAENKDRKKGAKSDLLDWDAKSHVPVRSPRSMDHIPPGPDQQAASEQYIANKAAAKRNKAAKGGGNPIEWTDGISNPISDEKNSAPNANAATAQYLENKAAARRNKTNKGGGNIIGSS